MAAGDDVRTPPRDVAAVQVVPVQYLYQRALSVPRTKRSRLFAFCAVTAGAPATGAPTRGTFVVNAFMQILIFVSTCVASVHELPVALK